MPTSETAFVSEKLFTPITFLLDAQRLKDDPQFERDDSL